MESFLGLAFIFICLVCLAVVIFWLIKNFEKKLLSYLSGELQKKQEETIKQAIKEENQSHREEFRRNSQALREEVNDSILKNTGSLRESLEKKLTDLTEQNKKDQGSLREEVFNQLDKVSSSVHQNNAELKNVVDQKMSQLTEQNKKDQGSLREEVFNQLDKVSSSVHQNNAELKNAVDQKMTQLTEQNKKDQSSLREEVFNQLDKVSSSVHQNNTELKNVVDQKMSQLTEQNKKDQEALKTEVGKQLDQVRETVNEKLQGTLEKRLQNAFSQVDEKLVQLHRGLGEIQNLSGNVKGLTQLMSNVKSRGIWGEIQLGRILEDIFSPHQYIKNAQVKKDSHERVEYAVKMPGRNKTDFVLLSIDAKFPLEDYQRLIEATQKENQIENIERYRKNLKDIIKKEAQNISKKYINPPMTTDFAILFLPTESLYAEVLSQPGLSESLQKQYKVLITGPTTLTALLLSLSVGFQTLAIEKKSTQVVRLLAAVKSQFGNFVTLLEKTEKKISSASQEIGRVTEKSKKIQHKLEGMHQIEQISSSEASDLLQIPLDSDSDSDSDNKNV